MAYAVISKISSIILDPIVVALLLLAASLLVKSSKRVKSFLELGAFILLILASSPVISDPLAASLERQYPDSSLLSLPTAQAIVVLGGSLTLPAQRHSASHIVDASDRLLVTLRLFRAGRAPLILCSGGNLTLFAKGSVPPEARVMSNLLQEWGVPPNAILTEESSVNTRENAIKSSDLLSVRHVGKIMLVTSATHMPRAVATFRKMGFEVVPVPADFRTGWDRDDMDWFPDAGSLAITKQVIREWIGLWIYRLNGWA